MNKNKAVKEFEERTGIKFSYGMSGKMSNIAALSTSCLCNERCKARMKNAASICAKCYAAATIGRYSALSKNMERNAAILSTTLIPVEEWPIVEQEIFRLEAFGDLINATHAENYINFVERNPDTKFALWTKNPDILAKVFEHRDKPENLVVIYSSPILNKLLVPEYGFIDKYFTVYDKEHAAEHVINCGARDCDTCRRCYSKETEIYIKELLK